MRILFVHSGADLYGASRSLLRLVRGLCRDGHEVRVVVPCDGALKETLEQQRIPVYVHHNLPVITRQSTKTIRCLLALICAVPISIVRLTRLTISFRPELIHSNTALILSPGIVAKIVRTPHVWHVREYFAEFPRVWRLYQKFMATFSTQIVCVSEAVAGQFSADIRGRKVIVLHNGFPKDEFQPVEARRINDFRQRFGLNGHLLVGTVGRIKLGRKGQDLLVQATSLIRHKFPHMKLLCIGSPFPGNEEHLSRLQKMVRELGLEQQFVYTGDVEDVQAAYAALDVSVLPSALPEPFGGTVIESMAMGKPVVGTNIGGTREQIEDGITGFLVPSDDPRPLACALETLLSDASLRRTMGEKGRNKFLRCFEFQPFYAKMLSIYESCLARERQTALLQHESD